MRTSRRSAIGAALLLLPLLLGHAPAAWPAAWQTVVDCPRSGTAGDPISRGFYIQSYAGLTLSQVTLSYSAAFLAGGTYSISLTARRGSFSGPIIGTTQIATVDLPGNVTPGATPDDPATTPGASVDVIFDFGGAPVNPFDTIVFTQAAEAVGGVTGPVYFDAGAGNCAGVFETSGTTPPLDTVVRNQVGVAITQAFSSAPCTASPTVLCVDNNLNDQRFKVTATFQTTQGGGSSGNAQAIPGAPLGINRGGMFWFFSQSNPELLVKVLNGCGVNNTFWVFASAGTNVGLTITVVDTHHPNVGTSIKTYTNADLHAMTPIQDNTAFPCP